MVPKAESAESIAALTDELAEIALCETARGVVEAERIAAVGRVTALMWGAEDLVASLGGASSRGPDGGYRDVARSARSRVLIAAGAFSKAAIDAVHLDIQDHEGLAREAEDAAAIGFAATRVHPPGSGSGRSVRRIGPMRPRSSGRVRCSRPPSGRTGVFVFDGRMVDEPVLRHARAILARSVP